MGGGFRIFSLAGIPVQVSVWYFIILAYWLSGDLRSGMLWAAAITVSILVHEFGHAFVARHYRLNPSIALHGWGGLCHHERAATDRNDALIIIAGPAAGLVLGGLVFAVTLVAGSSLYAEPALRYFVEALLRVNIFWSLANLLPLWPLDGGQLFRLGLLKVTTPAKAERITHVVGTILGVTACFVAFGIYNSRFVAIIAGLLTWMNVRRINDSSATGPIRAQNRHARTLMKQAKGAFESGDWETAARLGYQAKAESSLDPGIISQVFEILGVSNAAMGRFEEAWPFLQKAPDRPKVYLAKVECVLGLGKASEARTLASHKLAKDLPEDVRKDLEALAFSAA